MKSDQNNEDGIPIIEADNLNLTLISDEVKIKDSSGYFKECNGLYKKKLGLVVSESDPIIRYDIYSNRAFGPSFLPGKSLNAFFYEKTETLPRPMPPSGQNKIPQLPLFLMNAPDTLRGLTMFIVEGTKSSGQKLADTAWVVLQ